MTRLLYDRGDGTTARVNDPGGTNKYLSGNGKSISWETLDGKSIPYTSSESGSIANVSDALDILLNTIRSLRDDLNSERERSTQLEITLRDAVATMQREIAKLNTYVTESVNAVDRAKHDQASVSIISNPALKLLNGQQFTLDISARGSFDDSRSGLGVNSIQAAIEKLASRK